jgi:hypothetical protein
MKKITPSSLSRGILLLSFVVLASCGGSSNNEGTHDAKIIIVINSDAPASLDDAGQADVPLIPADAQVTPDDGGVSYVPFDAGLWRNPDTLFPDCQAGTAEQISDCIINLPTSSGIPVTRQDPMDYSACKP